MKTKEELESLKKEMAQLKSKLVELTDEELAVVTGGYFKPQYFPHNYTDYERKFSYNTQDICE